MQNGEYALCTEVLQFCAASAIPIKFTSFLKVLKEVAASKLNVQLGIDAAQRQQLFDAMYRYVQAIGGVCKFNIALPYKLLTAIAGKDEPAMAAYLEKYNAGYPNEFLQNYLVSFALLYVRKSSGM